MATANLMHDPDYYTKSFQYYAKKSDKYQVLANWGNNVFPTLVVDRLAESFLAGTSIKMLGVGSGSGEMDSQMAASIKSRFKSVHNTVLDPAERQLKLYSSLIERKKDEFQGIVFDLQQETIDGYRKKQTECDAAPAKFHFISAIHSLYYADDYKDTIGYLYDRLEEGGVLLTICIADTSGFWRLWDRFSRLHLCTSHFRDAFSSHSIPFHESRQKSEVDITECFVPDSEEGTMMVDFLNQMVDLRGTAGPEHYKEVVDYMGSDQCSERREDGTVLFNNDWDAIIAQKPVAK